MHCICHTHIPYTYSIDSCLIRKAFRQFDVGHRGLVSLHHWYKIIKLFNLQDILSRDSADLLMKKYAPKGQESYRSMNGTRRITGSPMGDALDYNALCDAIHQGRNKTKNIKLQIQYALIYIYIHIYVLWILQLFNLHFFSFF
jgi:hypothetical protein